MYLQNKFVPMLMSKVLLALANLDGVPYNGCSPWNQYAFHLTLISAIIQAYMWQFILIHFRSIMSWRKMYTDSYPWKGWNRSPSFCCPSKKCSRNCFNYRVSWRDFNTNMNLTIWRLNKIIKKWSLYWELCYTQKKTSHKIALNLPEVIKIDISKYFFRYLIQRNWEQMQWWEVSRWVSEEIRIYRIAQ